MYLVVAQSPVRVNSRGGVKKTQNGDGAEQALVSESEEGSGGHRVPGQLEL